MKSNLDSGICQAIQHMAIAAIEGPQGCIADNVAKLQKRRDAVVSTINKIGLKAIPPKASLYVWAKIPDGVTSGDFAAKMIEDIGVVVTPGAGYGPSGEGFIRLSLTIADDRMTEGLRRMEQWQYK